MDKLEHHPMKKTLILSLGRNNSLPVYAKEIYSNLPTDSFDVLLSKQSETKYLGSNRIEIHTYENKLQFILNTIFYLPFFLCVFSLKIFKRYKKLYLPYMHFWDLPFILVFKMLKRKIILTVHDGELHKGENGFLLRMLNRLEIMLADELIFLTPHVEKIVRTKYKVKKPLHIVPHGLLGERGIKVKERRRESGNLLFLGRISPYKGVELLMKTAENLNYFENLIIAGKSIYKLDYLRNAKIKIQDKYLSEAEITALLEWADVLVLPYLEASQSGVIPLGINAAIPMVCTNVGGLRDQLENDEAVFVEPNEHSLKAGIETLLNDTDLYNAIIAKLRHKKESLSWGTISEKVQRILT
ncbi:MAG: glycosyltransferase [Chryseobacterium sp.]|nr:MAG: glycosyltransferase [Chryseobacterium sp.]